MPVRAWSRAAAAIALLSITCACGGGGGGDAVVPPGPPGPPGPPAANWYVSATTGSDGGAGNVGSPFRTISFACTQATLGQSIYIYPGTYDASIGETFPIVVPPGVTVFGDEANKGAGVVATEVVGGGAVGFPAPAFVFATFHPGAGSTLAGLRIRDNLPQMPGQDPYALWLDAATFTLRNSHVVNSYFGALCSGGVGGHLIDGNVFQGNTRAALAFVGGGGVGSKVQGNVFTLNDIGVEFDSAGGDLGGGAAGSTGGNVISCNTSSDLWTNASITIDAQNNAWDHVPPTVGGGAGADLNPNAAAPTFVTTGATLAAGACP